MFFRLNLLLIVLVLPSLVTANEARDHEAFNDARRSFQHSLIHPAMIDQALDSFNNLLLEDMIKTSTALGYIGTLTALKAKHLFLPHLKIKHAWNGIHMLDDAVVLDPQDVEARFLRGMVNYSLPGIFLRSELALNDFEAVVSILETSGNSFVNTHIAIKMLELPVLTTRQVDRLNQFLAG